jgi:hypothetical protein
MADIQSSSLRSRLGDDVADPSLIIRPEGILSFGQNTSGPQPDRAVLDLVRQAATLIREKEQQAAETESRAHTLATRIISELKRGRSFARNRGGATGYRSARQGSEYQSSRGGD